MYCIVYLSSATRLYDEQELEDILKVSRRNNSAKGITGILLYINGSSVQLLEGPKEAVKNTYKHIMLDYRHSGFIKIMDEGLEQRNFPDWSMAYQKMSSREVEELTGYKDLSKMNFLGGHGKGTHPAIMLLKSFVKYNQ